MSGFLNFLTKNKSVPFFLMVLGGPLVLMNFNKIGLVLFFWIIRFNLKIDEEFELNSLTHFDSLFVQIQI